MPNSAEQPQPCDSPSHEHPEPIPLVSPSDLANPMLRVADVMTASPRTCAPESTAVEAVMIFRDADCGLIPVTEDGRPVGVLTDRDVALALSEHQADLAGVAVRDLMSRDPVSIPSDAPLQAAMHRLGDEGIRRLVVVDGDGLLAGVLSWADLIPHLSERGVGRVVSEIIRHR
jgi:CBS domain-containing protein